MMMSAGRPLPPPAPGKATRHNKGATFWPEACRRNAFFRATRATSHILQPYSLIILRGEKEQDLEAWTFPFRDTIFHFPDARDSSKPHVQARKDPARHTLSLSRALLASLSQLAPTSLCQRSAYTALLLERLFFFFPGSRFSCHCCQRNSWFPRSRRRPAYVIFLSFATGRCRRKVILYIGRPGRALYLLWEGTTTKNLPPETTQ
jgi:hypothetical protein